MENEKTKERKKGNALEAENMISNTLWIMNSEDKDEPVNLQNE